MANGFTGLIETLESWGLTDALLPFLLVFTIVFAILQKAKVFGEEKKNMNIVVALVLALLVVIPHITGSYPPGADVVDIMNRALPNISLVIVAIIALLLLLGIFGAEVSGTVSGGVVAVAFLVVLYIFGAAAGWWGNWQWITSFFGADAIAIAIIILVFAVLIWFITREEGKSGGPSPGGRLFKGLEDLFKKK